MKKRIAKTAYAMSRGGIVLQLSSIFIVLFQSLLSGWVSRLLSDIISAILNGFGNTTTV